MALVVSVPKDEDFLRMAEIRSLAFGSNHYIDMLFPKYETLSGRLKLRDRLLDMKNNDHTVRFVITTDTTTGEIVSQGEWHFYEPNEKPIPMDLGFVEGTEEEKEYARHCIGTFQARRRQAIEATRPGIPLMLLDSLTTDPKHQRRGAAMKLVQWGLDVVDNIKGEAYLEATEFGRPLYASLGFEVEDYWTIPLPEKWADRERVSCYLMRRPVQNLKP